MSPRFVLGRENVPCVAEVVNRSLKADITDFTLSCAAFVEYQIRDTVASFPISTKYARSEIWYRIWKTLNFYKLLSTPFSSTAFKRKVLLRDPDILEEISPATLAVTDVTFWIQKVIFSLLPAYAGM